MFDIEVCMCVFEATGFGRLRVGFDSVENSYLIAREEQYGEV